MKCLGQKIELKNALLYHGLKNMESDEFKKMSLRLLNLMIFEGKKA